MSKYDILIKRQKELFLITDGFFKQNKEILDEQINLLKEAFLNLLKDFPDFLTINKKETNQDVEFSLNINNGKEILFLTLIKEVKNVNFNVYSERNRLIPSFYTRNVEEKEIIKHLYKLTKSIVLLEELEKQDNLELNSKTDNHFYKEIIKSLKEKEKIKYLINSFNEEMNVLDETLSMYFGKDYEFYQNDIIMMKSEIFNSMILKQENFDFYDIIFNNKKLIKQKEESIKKEIINFIVNKIRKNKILFLENIDQHETKKHNINETKNMYQKELLNIYNQKKSYIKKAMKECGKEFKKIQKAIEKHTGNKVVLEKNIEEGKLSLLFNQVEIGLIEKEGVDENLCLYLNIDNNVRFSRTFNYYQISDMFSHIEDLMKNINFISSIY